MITDTPTIDRGAFERATGWALKPEGACKGHLCVPLGGHDGDTLALDALADRLGMGLVHDEGHDLWALGPETVGGQALTTAEAPDLRLPDRNGDEVALRDFRGTKVLLAAWASW